MNNSHQSFLLIRLSSLGDILLLTPALRALRQAHPQARIDILTSRRYEDLLAANPNINNLLLFPDFGDLNALRQFAQPLRRRYDVVIDLHTSLRSAFLRHWLAGKRTVRYRKHRWSRWFLTQMKWDFYRRAWALPSAYLAALKPLGVSDDGLGLEWPGAMAHRAAFLRMAKMPDGPSPLPIALCPGASYYTKRWPETRWRELAYRLLETEPIIWVLGDEHDHPVGEALHKVQHERIINYCGKLSLLQAGAALSLCRLAITHDAGPAHMAAAVGIPVLALFGSTVPQFGFRPFGVPHRIAEVNIPCRPCSHLGYVQCPIGHFRCMREIAVETVLQLFSELKAAPIHNP